MSLQCLHIEDISTHSLNEDKHKNNNNKCKRAEILRNCDFDQLNNLFSKSSSIQYLINNVCIKCKNTNRFDKYLPDDLKSDTTSNLFINEVNFLNVKLGLCLVHRRLLPHY